jgi:hypothetical protein
MPDAALRARVTPLPALADREICRSARAMMKYYRRRDSNRMYCDKSLDGGDAPP